MLVVLLREVLCTTLMGGPDCSDCTHTYIDISGTDTDLYSKEGTLVSEVIANRFVGVSNETTAAFTAFRRVGSSGSGSDVSTHCPVA